MTHILIVDDEPLTREFLQEKIPTLNEGCEVIGCCGDGREALDFLSGNEVDLILTDIKMPVMDGLEFSRQVREKFPHIPVVILSGFGDFDLAQQAIQNGVAGYILKPIVNAELKQLLQRMSSRVESDKREQKEMRRAERLLAIFDESIEENPGVVHAAAEYIMKNFHRPISLSMVAEEIGVSASYLSGLFHRKMGEPYVKYLTRVRMEAAAGYLNDYPAMLVSDIAERTGYMTTRHFLYVFKKHFGLTPTAYRERS